MGDWAAVLISTLPKVIVYSAFCLPVIRLAKLDLYYQLIHSGLSRVSEGEKKSFSGFDCTKCSWEVL